MKKLLIALLCLFPCLLVSEAFAGITYHGSTGQVVYARIQTAPTTFIAVAMPEGTSGGLGVYSVTDGALVTATLNVAGTYNFTVRAGTASTTANDTILGDGVIYWTGSAEYTTAATIAQIYVLLTTGSTFAEEMNTAGATPARLAKLDAPILNTSSDAASKFDRSAKSIVLGTVGASATTTSIPTSSLSPASTVANQFLGRIVIFDKDTATAALRGQATNITSNTSGGVLTVTALTTAPASGDTFTIN